MNDYINAIEIEGLCKKYDGFILDNISFQVPKGSIMGFIGQNGAGKTTTIRLLLNIIKKDSGTIRMLGMDHLAQEFEIKKQLAVVFDELPFQDMFSAAQISRVLC
ncbi:MAG: ATP-binding cassette domain-containing protein, partial [Oscillospiraceae bacterium]|nr:ATP-binding cassette domain-containing protein [Oscillospiraceae bacterium]